MDIVSGHFDFNFVGHRPFIHRDASSMKPWLESLDSLKGNFSLKTLSCSSDAYITDACRSVKLGDFFHDSGFSQESHLYISHVFHQNGRSLDLDLDNLFPTPECLNKSIVQRFRIKRFLAGPKGTGTALHQHSRAYFYNIVGVKRWFLAKPSQENNDSLASFSYDVNNKSIHSISDWFNSHASKLSVQLKDAFLFDLHPGDSLFIPDGFHHAVLNLTSTVGVAFSWESNFQQVLT